MSYRLLLYGFIFFSFSCHSNMESDKPRYAVVIHGGAGTIHKAQMSPEKELEYRKSLEEALVTAEKILQMGGLAIDAVEAAIVLMEDNPLFNAGKGSVFTSSGDNELDASIMNGADLNAGAVAGVKYIKNPIKAARAVMEFSDHVFLIGSGAELFSKQMGIELVDSSYFYTEQRWQSLLKVKESEKNKNIDIESNHKHGTVGVVALDNFGNIVSGTSTGGMTNKKYQRIGDSPLIGSGTYADNATCGVSCTGHGEYFIRLNVAYAVHAQIKYGNKSLSESAREVVHHQLVALGGEGGLIGLDKMGNIVMEFNSEGMYRGYALPNKRFIGIYKDE
jgi:L-asparaginase / beta-aspartyl-peptidase